MLFLPSLFDKGLRRLTHSAEGWYYAWLLRSDRPGKVPTRCKASAYHAMLLGAAAQSESPLPARPSGDFVFSDDECPAMPDDLICDSDSRRPQRRSKEKVCAKRATEADDFAASDGEAVSDSHAMQGSADEASDECDSNAASLVENDRDIDRSSAGGGDLSSTSSSSDSEDARADPVAHAVEDMPPVEIEPVAGTVRVVGELRFHFEHHRRKVTSARAYKRWIVGCPFAPRLLQETRRWHQSDCHAWRPRAHCIFDRLVRCRHLVLRHSACAAQAQRTRGVCGHADRISLARFAKPPH